MRDAVGEELKVGDLVVYEESGPLQRFDPEEPEPYRIILRTVYEVQRPNGVWMLAEYGVQRDRVWRDLDGIDPEQIHAVGPEFEPWVGLRCFRDSITSDGFDRYDPNPVRLWKLPDLGMSMVIRAVFFAKSIERIQYGGDFYITDFDYRALRAGFAQAAKYLVDMEDLQ